MQSSWANSDSKQKLIVNGRQLLGDTKGKGCSAGQGTCSYLFVCFTRRQVFSYAEIPLTRSYLFPVQAATVLLANTVILVASTCGG